jgi:hypothetical protein
MKAEGQLQLEFVFEDEPAPDPLAELLIATGLVPNHFVLELNRGLTNPHPEALPSRLFRFPIAFVARKTLDGKSRLLLNHPALAGHPFVQEVAAKTGEMPVWEPLDEFGRDRGALPRWWHAVDLMTEAHWRDLLATRHFTDDEAIAGAIGISLDRPAGISVAIAREVLAALGADEPADRSHGLLMSDAIQPAHIIERHPRTGKLIPEHWPVNVMDRSASGAWLMVHGIEDGWFERRRDGYLQLSPEGRRRRPEWRIGALIVAGDNEDAFHEAISALDADTDVDAAAAATLARAYTGDDGGWETREAAFGAIEAEFYRRWRPGHEIEDEREHGLGR